MEEDIEEMRAEERAQQAEASISMRELLCSPTLRAPLLIGVVMQLSQQLSGINAVSFAISSRHYMREDLDSISRELSGHKRGAQYQYGLG